MKKALKRAKTLKNLKEQQKKLQIFFVWRFYTGRKNFINKKGLFYAKFLEFEEFSVIPFFIVASSLSILLCKQPTRKVLEMYFKSIERLHNELCTNLTDLLQL